MDPKQFRTSALNLRTRAKTEANQERAAAWLKEADELDAKALILEQQQTAAAAAQAATEAQAAKMLQEATDLEAKAAALETKARAKP